MYSMKKLSSMALVAVVSLAAASGLAYDDNDGQLWLKAAASGKLDCGAKVSVSEEMKFGDGMSELYDVETGVGVGVSLTDFMSLSLAWKEVLERKVDSADWADDFAAWRVENRPYITMKFYIEPEGWKLEERIRGEYRMKDGSDNYVRLRNRIKIKTPWKMTQYKIRPWTAWELNWEDKSSLSGSDKFDRHRVYAGLGAKVSDHLDCGTYYCCQFDKKSDSWRKYHVWGISLTADF
jgi:hypothetical protein